MRPKDLPDNEQWESVCRCCGQCCYEKIDFEGRIYYTQLPCEHLDPVTRLCRIYPERDARRPGCVRLSPETLAKGFLPADCAYVAGIEEYPAPVMPEDDEVKSEK